MTEGTTGGSRRLRIGNVERNAAMKALDAHLEAGRLGVDEYGERSAGAAGAATAALDGYRRGPGYVDYTSVTATERRHLATVLDALAEPVSQLGAAVKAG